MNGVASGSRPLVRERDGMFPRIGFIGCGSFSSNCLYPSLRLAAFGLEPWGAEPMAELVACCDFNAELAQRNAKLFGFQRSYTDYHEMLEKEKLDAVFVVMHPRLQPAIAIDVMRSGANAFIEKPPTQTLAESRDVQRVQRETGKFCQVGFMKRFSEPYLKAKEIMNRSEFGRPSVYESRKARFAPYPPVYDYLNDFVCHHIDLARFFMGDVGYVYAEHVVRAEDPHGYNAEIMNMPDVYINWPKYLHEMPNVPQEDGYLITFRFADGAIGMHNANTLETESNLLERVAISGQGAVVAVEDWHRVRANVKDEPTYTWEPFLIDKSMNNRLTMTGYLGEVQEFIGATREGRKSAVTIDDGVACLEIVAAVRRSIAEARRVSIAEVQAS
jgi:predicted dehydrogenase